MLQGGLIGAGVMIGLLLIPIVHFFTALPSPFIGGFIGGSKTATLPHQALGVGAVMAVVAFGTVAVAAVALDAALLYAIAALAGLYVGGLGALGALLGGRSARDKAAPVAEAGQPPAAP